MACDPRYTIDRGVTNHWTGLLDWTTGLDYWTQNLTTKSHFPAVTTTKIYCQSSSKAVPLAARASGHLSIVATPRQGCNREIEIACVAFSVAKHWIGGLMAA